MYICFIFKIKDFLHNLKNLIMFNFLLSAVNSNRHSFSILFY